jgi:4-hydroxy-tetrahydrodipicolinate synthase
MKRKFIPVMLTPFNDKGSVDYDGLTALTEFYIESGAGGLFANCLSSEMFELDDKERMDVTAHVVKIAAGSIPVFSTGTFAKNPFEQAEFIKKLYDCGASAIVVITGLLATKDESDDILCDRMQKLMTLTSDIPLGFYECPIPYKRLLPARLLNEFASTGRIVYHKDTSLCINEIKSKLAATQEHAVELYDAYMVNAVASLQAGCAGLSCIQGNWIPELIVWLCENFSDPALRQEVRLVQQFLDNNMELMHNTYPISAKYFLQKRGLPIQTTTRRDVGNFSDHDQRKVNQLFDDIRLLQDKIGLAQKLTA